MRPEIYPVYKIEYTIELVDPHMPPNRYHTAIFVQNKLGNGTLHHVIGELTFREGMSYSSREVRDPRSSPLFYSRELLGYTRARTHPQIWETVLKSLPTPPQQKAPNPARGGQPEPFKEKVSDLHYVFYKAGEEHKPLWKCTEWVDWYAIPSLRRNNLLQ